MSATKPQPIQRDWITKTLAGALLGFSLALACSGVFARLNPALAVSAKAQLAMWMIAPIWLGTLAGTFFFASGRRACLGLGAANLLAFGALAALRTLAPGA